MGVEARHMNPSDTIRLTIDAKGLPAPLPIIRVKKGLGAIEVGEILEVWTTDVTSGDDFRSFMRSTGHELVRVEEEAPPFRFLIRRTR